MKKVLKILGFILAGVVVLLLVGYAIMHFNAKSISKANMALLGNEAPVLNVGGLQYRDLNKNGSLDVYEDSRAAIDDRVENLLGQMTIAEKAGLMFITMIVMDNDGGLNESPSVTNPMTFFFETNSEMVINKHMNHFNIIQSPSAKALVTWNNNVQKMAERTRLGIPVTVASDPRHGTPDNPGAGIGTPFFSTWPSPLGFGAIDDTTLMQTFGDIARQEYLATGIRLALHPMADLATEPRWARIVGTFGEDAELSARLTRAYVLGFQGDTISENSVMCMTKHFSGGGPQKDGEDAHFDYGADQAYPGDNFDYHVIPFTKGAFPAHTGQIMPYYGVPVGQTSEDVAFAFNKEIIQDLLRDSLGFEGVICTDWGLITGNSFKPAANWGVEDLSPVELTKKILDAGCDMFGGETCVENVIEVVESGLLPESRIDASVRRILRDKFALGLFDDPYLDESGLDVLDNPNFKARGQEAQRKSLVLLKNDNLLPLAPGTKVYLEGISGDGNSDNGEIVKKPEDADVIIMKLATPFDPRSEYLLERFFHQGRLDFPAEEKAGILDLISKKPTVTVMTIERPPVFPEIAAASGAVIADFACENQIILDLIFGRSNPTGKLPIEIPSSVEAVKNQFEDMPYDSKDPLYEFGHGLSYD